MPLRLCACRIDINLICVVAAVSPRPTIFISAVSQELRSARRLVANTLTFLGYEPVWQDIFGTEGGDLREILRRQIDQCKGVVQLVGRCYGAQAPVADKEFGRVSYRQYEGLYARQRGMSYRAVIKEVHYSLNSDALDKTFKV